VILQRHGEGTTCGLFRLRLFRESAKANGTKDRNKRGGSVARSPHHYHLEVRQKKKMEEVRSKEGSSKIAVHEFF